MAFQVLEKLHKLHDGYFAAFQLSGLNLLLIQIDGKRYAYENACPHQGAPLTYGTITDGKIRCPLHGIEYQLSDGEPVMANTGPLTPIELVYRDNLVGVDIAQ
jgi:3-phenylpropionate/trans-cinnamate dioxygenase ferredoxin subunit